MNANELMTGDWVRIKDLKDTIKRLVCVDEYLGKVDFLDGEELITTSIDNVLPIPLTADILEKNGFEWRAYGIVLAGEDMALVQCGDYWKIKPNQDSNDTFCYIWHVHELQHSLRLCSIEKEIVLNH